MYINDNELEDTIDQTCSFTKLKTRNKCHKKFSKPLFKTFLKYAKENQRERPTLFPREHDITS